MDPDAVIQVVVSVASDASDGAVTAAAPPNVESESNAGTAAEPIPTLQPETEPTAPSFSEAEWAELCSGLLLVDLTGSSAEAAPSR